MLVLDGTFHNPYDKEDEYHNIETIETLNSAYQAIIRSYMKLKYIYWGFLLFQFCDTYLEVSLISLNMYHLELMPESYNLI